MKALLLNREGSDFHARVRSCFEKDGTFVAVLFGAEAVDRTEDQTEEACRDVIARIRVQDAGYWNPLVQNRVEPIPRCPTSLTAAD